MSARISQWIGWCCIAGAATPWIAEAAPATACTAAEHRQFDFWVGQWTVRWVDADKREQQGRNRITLIHDGCALREEFDGRPGTPLTGSSLSIYVPASKRWKQTWVDNSGSHLDFEGSWDGGRMTLARAAPELGATVLQRMVFHTIAADSMVWDWESSRDGGANWKLQWRLRYERER